MGTLKGITVKLWEKTEISVDEFNDPIYEETPIEVENVLVYPSTPEEILETTNLYGRKAVYTLAIPKGDAHDWENNRIDFFGESWRSFGIPIKGIEDLIPLDWNMKVMVERYE